MIAPDLEPLCAAVDTGVSADQADAARALVKGVLELHAGALARALELIGPELADRLAADDLVGAVLMLHDLHPHPPARRIETALRAHGDRLERHGVIAEAVVVDGDRALIRVVGALSSAGEAEIAAIALAAAPEVEAVDVVASGAALVPVERLRAREGCAVTRDAAGAIARAVLYEGYSLYPYRATNVKNRRRWTIGAVLPRTWCEAAGSGDRWRARAELLARAPEAATSGGVLRFLSTSPAHAERGARSAPSRSGALDERAVELAPRPLADGRATTLHVVDALAIEIERDAVEVASGLWRIAVAVANTTPIDAALTRDDALAYALGSAHVVVELAGGGELLSLVDPPADAAAAAAGCAQDGWWPALLGPRTALAAPMILPDRPEIAPESPGDLFDATEIDEILILRVLTLTDAEKREARAGDPRVAALIDRCEALGPEAVLALHGRRRDAGPAPGDRVTLRPRPKGDVLDLALAGRRATVASVEHDLDGRTHVVVTVDDDPGADLGLAGYPGHRFFFAPDEVEPR